MRLVSICSAALCLGLIAGQAQARITVYTCKLTPATKGAWIGRDLILRHDESSGEVTVLDNIIDHYLGAPQPARVEVQNATRTSFVWVLEKFGAKAGDDLQFTAGFRFRASFRDGGRSVQVTSKPRGYSNSFRGKGTCTVARQD